MSEFKVLISGRPDAIVLTADGFELEDKHYVLRQAKRVVGQFPEKSVVGIWEADTEKQPKLAQSIVIQAKTIEPLRGDSNPAKESRHAKK